MGIDVFLLKKRRFCSTLVCSTSVMRGHESPFITSSIPRDTIEHHTTWPSTPALTLEQICVLYIEELLVKETNDELVNNLRQEQEARKHCRSYELR